MSDVERTPGVYPTTIENSGGNQTVEPRRSSRRSTRVPMTTALKIIGLLRARLARLLRYAAVSAISTATSLTVLGVLVGLANAPAGWANVAATAIGTVPSFELNRRWVWLKRGARSIWGEVVPFATLALAGLVLSTVTVHLAS